MNLKDEFKDIGPKSREMLQAAGITKMEQLRKLGSVNAYVRVKRAGCNPSLNFLWALEAVLTGEHWQVVAKKHRLSLLSALEDAEKS
jgi:DNA transformation protein and related proteins